MKKKVYLIVAILCITLFKIQLYAQNLVSNGSFEAGNTPTFSLTDFSGNVSNWDEAQYNGDNCGSSTAYHNAGSHPCGAADYVSNAVDNDYIRENHCSTTPPANRFARIAAGSVSHIGGFCHHTVGIRTGLQKDGQPYSMIPGHTYNLKLKLRVATKGDPNLRVHFAKFGVNWNANPSTSQNIRWLNGANFNLNHNDYDPCTWYAFEQTFTVPTQCEDIACSGMQNMILYLEDNNSTLQEPKISIDDVELYDIGCCIPYKLIENTSSLSSLTKTSDYIKAGFDAGIANTSGNVTVLNGQNVTFKAGNLINLLPGFSVQNGGVFRGALEYCTGESESTGNIDVAFWPNVFTPNGDGINDNYCVNVTGATQFSIQVFDSWGVLRFDDTGIISNSFACIWNGDNNQGSSGKVPNGTYYSIIKFFNCSGSIEHPQTISIYGSPGIKTEKELQQIVSIDENKFKPVSNSNDVVLDLATLAAKDETDFMVTPNPTSGAIQILFKTGQERNVNVVNILGETLYSTREEATTLEINLSDYAKGIYFISVIDRKGHKCIKKVVKD